MASWKKVIVSGSNISTLNNDANYLTSTSGILSASAQIAADISGSANARFETLNTHTGSILSTQVIAGTGLTGGGTLAANRTFNVASANNGIVANANDIELAVGSSTFTVGVKSKLDAEGVLSSSAQIDGAFLNTLGDGVLSGSAQIAVDISGSLSAAAIVALGATIVSGSATQIRLASTTGFPTGGGTIAVGSELITYTGVAGAELTGITRAQKGTSSAIHSTGATVTNATEFTGWGDAVDAGTITLEPGLWSLSNFGDVLVATIANGKTFTWNAGIAARFTTRASTGTSGFSTANNPTATRVTLVSPTTRHLIHLGTETVVGDASSQDDMFIRFSEQENIPINSTEGFIRQIKYSHNLNIELFMKNQNTTWISVF